MLKSKIHCPGFGVLHSYHQIAFKLQSIIPSPKHLHSTETVATSLSPRRYAGWTKPLLIKFVPFFAFFMFILLCMNALAIATAQPLLIQKTGDYRVYYVSNGIKRHIPDPETFEILRFDWDAITTVTQTQFDNYTPGTPIPLLRSGIAMDGSLVRRESEIEVYLIESGLRRWIPDPETLNALGRRFNEVISLDAELFDRIPRGVDISSANDNFIYFVSELGANGAGGYDSGVNTAIGNFTHQMTGLDIPGRGLPFVFTAMYNAKASYNPKSSEWHIMGPGWTHSYNIMATEIQKDGVNRFVLIKWGDGHEEIYKWNGTAYKANGVHNIITGGGGSTTLTVTTKSQIKYTFEFLDYTLDSMRMNRYILKTISDRNGNTITLNYSGILSSITDTVGRSISFSYTQMTDSSGTIITRLTRVTDPIGRTIEFTYDTEETPYDTRDGSLVKIKDLNGGITTFSYKKVHGLITHLIETITDPRGKPYVGKASYKEGITNRAFKNLMSINIGGLSPKNFDYDNNTNETIVSTTDLVTPMTVTNRHKKDSLNRIISFTPNDGMGSVLIAWDDAHGLPFDLSSLTDRTGKQTFFSNDERGNVLTITDALNQVTTFQYDQMNNLLSKTDPLNRVTTYTYDAKGNLTRITMPIGTINVTYNVYGQPETVTDSNGNTTNYVYDTQGNLVEIRELMGRTTKFSYDGVGRKIVETDPNGNAAYFTYDNNNNLLTIKNAMNQTVTYRYDANGNRTAVIDENGNTTTYTYDERNRLIWVTDPEGGVTGYLYDSFDRLIQMTDADGKGTRYEYDPVGNLTKVNDANGGTVVYTYDSKGNRLSMTDPNGSITNYTYDVLNRLTSKREPLGNQYSYSYDAAGNLVSMTDAKNNTTSYAYDSMDRLTRVTYPDGSYVSFVYDNNGNRISMTDSLETTTYSYDPLNRLVRYTDPSGKVVGYEYDSNNNRTSIIYPDSKRVQYGYDALNRLTSVRDWFNKTTTYSYDSAGRLTGTVNPNGTSVTYSYDNAGRLTGLINRKANNTIISSYSYRLDAVGNHLQSAQIEPLLPVMPDKDVSHTHDAENRLTSSGGISYSFDNNGNLIGRGSSDNFIYDYRDKLIQSFIGGKTTQYGYDGAGNRLSRTESGVTKRYVLDINSDLPNVIAETDGNGTITAYYVYGLGLISRVLPDGTAFY